MADEDREGQDGAHQDDGGPGFPSLAELRRRTEWMHERIGTGWPAVDAVTHGLPRVGTTVVRAPLELRLQVLGRLAAWTAGDSYPTLIASRAVTTDELRMAVAAGALGLPPRALLESTSHDAWLDDRLRVLDLRVYGGPRAHEQAGEALLSRPPAVLVVDDYLTSMTEWDQALDTLEGRLDLELFPRRLTLSMVLGVTTMDYFSDWLDHGALSIRLVPSDDGRRADVRCASGRRRDYCTAVLRDGFLEPPAPGSALLHRPGVRNIWSDRSDEGIGAFAETLGASSAVLFWDNDDDWRDKC